MHFESWPDLLDVLSLKSVRPRLRLKAHRQLTKEKREQMVPRTCLGRNCGVTFMSWGPENRLCESCRQSDTYLSADDDEPYPLMIPKLGRSYV
jgi:hypothetical protein